MVVVMIYVTVGADWFSKEVFNVLLSLNCAVISWVVTEVWLDPDLIGKLEVTILLLKYFKVINIIFIFVPFQQSIL